MNAPLLRAEDLQKEYNRRVGLLRRASTVHAVRGVSFELSPGRVLCLVGESGCGKSTVGRIVADVVPPSRGRLYLAGQELFSLRGKARDALSLQTQLVHQDPFAALNPARTVLQALAAPLEWHRLVHGKRAVRARVEELLNAVGLTPPSSYLDKYPHQLSGGQRQRVVIARALAVEPKVIVADEAVSMVDVSLRVGILRTLQELIDTRSMAMLFITHDFGVARFIGYRQQLAVMYLGEFVEVGTTEEVIHQPAHPYTLMLLSAVPLADPIANRRRQRLLPTSDEVPDATRVPRGCAFADRCPLATQLCYEVRPQLAPAPVNNRLVACHHSDQVEALTHAVRGGKSQNYPTWRTGD